MESIIQAHKHKNVSTLVLRRTFPELEKSIIEQFRKIVPRAMYKSWNESKHSVTWTNGSTTYFGYSENEKDITQYQGAEFLFVGFDELTHFTLKQWEFMKSRNRCPVEGSRPCMAGASNPGDRGHDWVRSLFIDKKPSRDADQEAASLYNPSDYEFIPAKVTDNPIYANDQSYLDSLRSLPKVMRQMYLEGSWDIAIGAYFDIWNEASMTVRPEEIEAKPWWPRWISIDWGFAHNLSVHWHVATPADGSGKRQVTTYREWVSKGLGPRDVGRIIAEKSKLYGQDGFENIDAIYISPDTQQKRTDADTIFVQLQASLREHGLPISMELADNDRVGGWMLMYELLQSGEWKIASSCPEAIRAIPSLIRDPDFIEDILKTEGVADDVADELRYGLKSRLKNRKRKPPLEERVLARVNPNLDPTNRAIQVRKVLQEEKKASKPLSIIRPSRYRAGIRSG
jgi:Phage terminase large subunit